MKAFHLLLAAMAIGTASGAIAGDRAGTGGLRLPVPSQNHFSWEGGHGFKGGHHGFPVFLVVEREVPVIVEREVVVREVAAPPPPPLPAPRKPYVVGASYASLPGGCMKMIEGSASYYYCGGGEWYLLTGKQYRAVARP